MFRSLIAAALIAVAPASVPNDADVTKALFDICPGVMAGKFDLGKPADLTAIGYAKSTPRGEAVWARRGEGAELILLSQLPPEEGETGAPSCGVMFTDDEGHKRFATMEAEARKRGFDGPPPGPMRDAPKARIVTLKREGVTLAMIAVANHIELSDTPSTIALLYND